MKQKDLAKYYEIPLTLKTKKETTGKKELEEIFYKTGDPILEKVMEIRSLDTNINNYIPNWKPWKDGRVHTTWGFSAPSGQKDSRSPNILNCSKHTVIGKLFRGIIEAPPGYTFVEFDKKSFHVGTMGYAACDPSYIRFSQLDPHSIFTSYIMPKSWGSPIEMSMSDGEILDRCKWIKARCKAEKEKDPKHGVNIRQDTAKPTVLGNQLGLGPMKLWRMNRRAIHSLGEAKSLQSIIAELFSIVNNFKDSIRELAHNQTFLLLKEWGKIQYFFDVFNYRYNKRTGGWIRGNGTDSEKAIAFPVQGHAFGMIDLETMDLDDEGYLEEFNFLLGIHDSLMFMPEDGKVDKCIEIVSKRMGEPCSKLVNKATGKDGLQIAVEIAVGKNWREMKEITL